jgi:hypothetical protein
MATTFPVQAAPGVDERVRRMEATLRALRAARDANRVPYWASYQDERGVERFSLVTDSRYALVRPENAARRVQALAAFERAIERYERTVDELAGAGSS